MITSVRTIRLLAGGILTLACLNAAAQQPQQQQPQEPPVFSWTVPVVNQGDTFRAVYRPRVPASNVKGYIYFFKNFTWQGVDLPMTKTDTAWVGAKLVPEGASLLCCRFYTGDSIDRGNKWPYVVLIHDNSGQLAPGAYSEYALMRRPQADAMMLDIVSPESLFEARFAVGLYLGKEWANVQVRRHLFYEIATTFAAFFTPEKTDSILRAGASEIMELPDVSEKEMLTVKRVYQSVLHNRPSSDSVLKIILSKYPTGLAAREEEINKIALNMNAEEHLQKWYSFLQTYPDNTYPFADYSNPVWGNSYFANNFNFEGITLFRKKDLEGLKKMADQAPMNLLAYLYLHYVEFPFHQTEPPITEAQAYDIGKAYMKNMLSRLYNTDAAVSGRGIYAASEWPAVYMNQQRLVFTNYAKLLYEAGDYAEAGTFYPMLHESIGYSSTPFNDLYVKLLMHDKKEQEAVAYVKAAVYANEFTGDMMKVLKADYGKNKGDEKAFPAYVVAMKSKEGTEREHANIRKAMMKAAAPALSLKDTKGATVTLEAQKGKIVVLDFWATWCYPCKAAMPGMQLAVERYKNDKDVAFYFIATLEQSPRYKRMIDSFITAKKYDFRVLYDNKNDSTQQLDQAYQDFKKVLHFNGIPEKVIIDQNGVIRWWSSAGNDNHIALAEEISYVVELLKKEGETKQSASLSANKQ
ncbi:AhpC/TSA family protein [Filimonas lacunae]|uniref:AhpC/TSA family protein n=1 Tax=Filimonas lacunae TaxID=477680 RepID=A0A173MCW3_9BACT|nr:TlpA disulfide reductase family protein [Filimonas lacunae]BAV05395.1 thiol:disulfide oxidoreductase related to ResA [Filimonas lacunae]SIT21464.1 AhpC/TSA family protein [Filimonas lacunae]